MLLPHILNCSIKSLDNRYIFIAIMNHDDLLFLFINTRSLNTITNLSFFFYWLQLLLLNTILYSPFLHYCIYIYICYYILTINHYYILTYHSCPPRTWTAASACCARSSCSRSSWARWASPWKPLPDPVGGGRDHKGQESIWSYYG